MSSCPTGYKRNKNSCVRFANPLSLSCPAGATLSKDSKTCVTTVAASLICNHGYVYGAGFCQPIVPSIRTPCPTGFKVDGDFCVQAIAATKTCPAGTVQSGLKCTEAKPNTGLKCTTTGFRKVGGRCIKLGCPETTTLINGHCRPTICPRGSHRSSAGDCVRRTCLVGYTRVNGVCTAPTTTTLIQDAPIDTATPPVAGEPEKPIQATPPQSDIGPDGKCRAADATLVCGKCVLPACPGGFQRVDGLCMRYETNANPDKDCPPKFHFYQGTCVPEWNNPKHDCVNGLVKGKDGVCRPPAGQPEPCQDGYARECAECPCRPSLPCPEGERRHALSGMCQKIGESACPEGQEMFVGKCVPIGSEGGQAPCQTGYERPPQGGVCRPINKVEQIGLCPADYFATGTHCVKEAARLDSAVVSDRCQAGSALSASGACVPISPAANIPACPIGWTLRGETCIGKAPGGFDDVEFCPKGFYEFKGSCVSVLTNLCPKNWQIIDNACVPTKPAYDTAICPPDYTSVRGRCVLPGQDARDQCGPNEIAEGTKCSTTIALSELAEPLTGGCPAGFSRNAGHCVSTTKVMSSATHETAVTRVSPVTLVRKLTAALDDGSCPAGHVARVPGHCVSSSEAVHAGTVAQVLLELDLAPVSQDPAYQSGYEAGLAALKSVESSQTQQATQEEIRQQRAAEDATQAYKQSLATQERQRERNVEDEEQQRQEEQATEERRDQRNAEEAEQANESRYIPRSASSYAASSASYEDKQAAQAQEESNEEEAAHEEEEQARVVPEVRVIRDRAPTRGANGVSTNAIVREAQRVRDTTRSGARALQKSIRAASQEETSEVRRGTREAATETHQQGFQSRSTTRNANRRDQAQAQKDAKRERGTVRRNAERDSKAAERVRKTERRDAEALDEKIDGIRSEQENKQFTGLERREEEREQRSEEHTANILHRDEERRRFARMRREERKENGKVERKLDREREDNSMEKNFAALRSRSRRDFGEIAEEDRDTRVRNEVRRDTNAQEEQREDMQQVENNMENQEEQGEERREMNRMGEEAEKAVSDKRAMRRGLDSVASKARKDAERERKTERRDAKSLKNKMSRTETSKTEARDSKKVRDLIRREDSRKKASSEASALRKTLQSGFSSAKKAERRAESKVNSRVSSMGASEREAARFKQLRRGERKDAQADAKAASSSASSIKNQIRRQEDSAQMRQGMDSIKSDISSAEQSQQNADQRVNRKVRREGRRARRETEQTAQQEERQDSREAQSVENSMEQASSDVQGAEASAEAQQQEGGSIQKEIESAKSKLKARAKQEVDKLKGKAKAWGQKKVNELKGKATAWGKNKLKGLASKYKGKLDGVMNKVNSLKGKLSGVANKVKGFKSKMDGIKGKISGKINGLKSKLTGKLNSKISGLKGKLESKIKGKLGDMGKKLGDKLKGKAAGFLKNKAAGFLKSKAGNMIKNKAAGFLKSKAGDFLKKKGMDLLKKQGLKVAAHFVPGLGQAMTAYEGAKAAIKIGKIGLKVGKKVFSGLRRF